MELVNKPKPILGELLKLRADIRYIKDHMVDADCVMTEDDYSAVQAYRHQKAQGKLISHNEVRRKLGL